MFHRETDVIHIIQIRNLPLNKVEDATKNAILTSVTEKFNTHASSCETARKNTNSIIKRLEGLDYTEYQVNYEKSTNDLSKMSK